MVWCTVKHVDDVASLDALLFSMSTKWFVVMAVEDGGDVDDDDSITIVVTLC